MRSTLKQDLRVETLQEVGKITGTGLCMNSWIIFGSSDIKMKVISDW
jgi:hypothetical protein